MGMGSGLVAGKGRLAVGVTAALAPAMWGTTYLLTTQVLPEGRPLLLSAARALPAGLLLLLLGRKLPSGRWWWRSLVLGMLNIGFFFPLVFFGAYHLPGGVASTIGAIQPLLVAALGIGLLGVKPSRRAVVAGIVGVFGVGLMVLRAGAAPNLPGVLAMVTGVALMALATTLIRRWGRPEGATLVDLTAWQLTIGGLFLAPLAYVVEGVPPVPTGANLLGFAYLGLLSTALGYVLWFRGIEKLGAGPASFLGLINPLVATMGGLIVLHQTLTLWQVLGLVLALGAMLVGQAPARQRPVPTPEVEEEEPAAVVSVPSGRQPRLPAA